MFGRCATLPYKKQGGTAVPPYSVPIKTSRVRVGPGKPETKTGLPTTQNLIIGICQAGVSLRGQHWLRKRAHVWLRAYSKKTATTKHSSGHNHNITVVPSQVWKLTRTGKSKPSNPPPHVPVVHRRSLIGLAVKSN